MDESMTLSLALLLERQHENQNAISALMRKVKQADSVVERRIEVLENDKTVIYTENEWFLKNGWKDRTGRVDLRKIAEFMDYRNKRFFKRFLGKGHFEEYVSPDNTHSGQGGETLKPSLFTISFPGRLRSDVFTILAYEMKLQMDSSGQSVHIMNSPKFGKSHDKNELPVEWIEAFQHLEAWNDMVRHLKSIEVGNEGNLYSNGTSGPLWFVQRWGRAAWFCAENARTTGSGVIIFKAWRGYSESVWCKLEFLFCKCLVHLFPMSVYVVNGFDMSTKTSKGYYMNGQEEF